jgi:hypothetical protein
VPLHTAAPQWLNDLAPSTQGLGWTVRGQIFHVVGVEPHLERNRDPRVKIPRYEHVRNELGKCAEYGVRVRQRRTSPELVAKLEPVLAQRLSTQLSPRLTDTSIIAGPLGPDQGATKVLIHTFGVWDFE